MINHDQAAWLRAGSPRKDGKPIPIPYNCACGTPSCYGDDDGWYCTQCWIAKAAAP